jgi:hypothetical protein
VDQEQLINPNGPIVNDLPIDVLGQLKREEGPGYTQVRMNELMAELEQSPTDQRQ